VLSDPPPEIPAEWSSLAFLSSSLQCNRLHDPVFFPLLSWAIYGTFPPPKDPKSCFVFLTAHKTWIDVLFSSLLGFSRLPLRCLIQHHNLHPAQSCPPASIYNSPFLFDEHANFFSDPLLCLLFWFRKNTKVLQNLMHSGYWRKLLGLVFFSLIQVFRLPKYGCQLLDIFFPL